MSFAIAVQFQQVLLKATFILEVQVNLQQRHFNLAVRQHTGRCLPPQPVG